MDRIKRKVGGEIQEYDVFDSREDPVERLNPIYWQEATKGDWAYTDDGYVAQCLERKTYTDAHKRTKTLVKLTCGVQWVQPNSKLLYEPNKAAGIYSMVKPRSWQEREVKRQRTSNVVTAYVQQLVNGQKPDWPMLGNMYRPDQQIPEATVKRLFKQKVIKNMVEEKMKEVLASRGVSKGFVLDTMLKAIDIAESKQDVSNMLRAAENFVDMLEMKPSRKVTTDTLQIDMSSQIMDKIETEEKKLIASRKIEEKTKDESTLP